ncbi:MAG: TolC family protein [candidate division Zixibacteria bacterium]|nr:TolC family protein [candidate division Zixibacteria bacterium]
MWPNVGTSLEPGALADEVLAANPAAAAASARAEAFERAAAAEGLWPDPQLTVEASNLPAGELAFDRSPMSGLQFYLRQTIPLPGKNTYRRRAAEGSAAAAAADYQATRLKLVERAKHAYFDLYFATALRDVVEKQRAFWVDYERVALARYAAGRGLQADVLKAQVERTLPANELLELSRHETVARGRINVLLNRAPGDALPPPAGLPDATVPYSLEDLYDIALVNDPGVAAAEARLASARAARSLAKASFLPDLTAGVGYRVRADVPMDPVAGEDFWSFSAGVSLPFFGTVKQKRTLAEKNAAVSAAEAAAADVKNNLQREVEELYVATQTAEEQLALFDEGIIPQAEAALRSTLAAYEAGKVDFATLLQSQLTLFKYEKEYVHVQVRRHKAIASLEAVAGERFY